MKIVAFSDTHGEHRNIEIPDGDALIFAGDMCSIGSLNEFKDFVEWFASLPHDTKIMIAGNHDSCLEDRRRTEAIRLINENNICYLEDNYTYIGSGDESFKVYGSPWTPAFTHWVFQEERGELMNIWENIPDDTDVLVTHGPPKGVGDTISDFGHIGDEDLKERVEEVQPLIHLFGHVHENFGRFEGNKFNVSILNEEYEIVNEPIVINTEDL